MKELLTYLFCSFSFLLINLEGLWWETLQDSKLKENLRQIFYFLVGWSYFPFLTLVKGREDLFRNALFYCAPLDRLRFPPLLWSPSTVFLGSWLHHQCQLCLLPHMPSCEPFSCLQNTVLHLVMSTVQPQALGHVLTTMLSPRWYWFLSALSSQTLPSLPAEVQSNSES